MDKTSGGSNEREQGWEDRQRSIDAMIPAGLTGQVREKARDALMTATVILGMSRTDILDRVQDLAKENGLTTQSARVWLLFAKETQDLAQSAGRQIGSEGTRRTLAPSLGYDRDDVTTLGLGAVFRREVTGKGIGTSAADDLRRELNREAGHHMDSIQGRNGVLSYDQIADGWAGGDGHGTGGTGPDGRGGGHGAGAAGLAGRDGEADPDIGLDGDGEDGSDAGPGHEDSAIRGEEDPDVAVGKAAGRHPVDQREVDQQNIFRVHESGPLGNGSGALDGGWFKNAARRNPREAAMERADQRVAALNRKAGGFRGTDKEFSGFANAHPDLDKNQLRLLRKGLTDADYLGFRVYVENGHLLEDDRRGGDRIATRTRACLLMASEGSARGFQNSLRAKIRLFDRLPDPGMEKVSIGHAARMAAPLAALTEAHRVRVEAGIGNNRKAAKNRQEPGLER